MRETSPAQSAASSPPTPCRTSTITSLSSAGSRSTSASLSSSSSLATSLSSSAGHRRELGIVLRLGEICARAPPVAGRAHRGLELLQPPAELRRLAVVGVDGRVGHPALELVVRALELLDELVEGHTARL